MDILHPLPLLAQKTVLHFGAAILQSAGLSLCYTAE